MLILLWSVSETTLYVNNAIYNRTNNIYSLSLAKEYLRQDDTLLFESDIIFENSILDDIIEDPRDSLALVAKYESWMDGTCVCIDENDNIIEVISGRKLRFCETSNYFKTVNIYKFSKHFSNTYYVPFLEAYIKASGNNEYYEQVLRIITALDNPEIKAKRLHDQLWYEIDDIQDIDIAQSIFEANPDKKTDLILLRHGGYWRYPKMIDFCFLSNSYYPPARLKSEMMASFDQLLTKYPSGIKVNSLIAAKYFDLNEENILVGNP